MCSFCAVECEINIVECSQQLIRGSSSTSSTIRERVLPDLTNNFTLELARFASRRLSVEFPRRRRCCALKLSASHRARQTDATRCFPHYTCVCPLYHLLANERRPLFALTIHKRAALHLLFEAREISSHLASSLSADHERKSQLDSIL